MAWRRQLVAALPDGAVQRLRSARRAAVRLSAPVRRLRPEPSFPDVPAAGTRLLVAPANFAGQGWAWARAAADCLDDVAVIVMAMENGAFGFPADYRVTRSVYRHPYWQRRQEQYVAASFTHVLIEAGRPVLGPRYADDCGGDVAVLRRRGLSVALAAHGSDVRLPSRHAAREPYSPFHRQDAVTAKLERQARRLGGVFAAFDGPAFVSTPDLLLDAPRATWLPVVVDPSRWANREPVLTRSRPVVVHAPSNPWLKGSEVVDEVMGALAERGVVEYRRIEGVPAEQMPGVLAGADIVVDQLRMGLYGVAACEAMAAGRLVLSYVGEQVREHVRQHTGEAVPIMEADPGTLADVVDGVLADRDHARRLAARGPSFVSKIHDGRWSAGVLRAWLGKGR